MEKIASRSLEVIVLLILLWPTFLPFVSEVGRVIPLTSWKRLGFWGRERSVVLYFTRYVWYRVGRPPRTAKTSSSQRHSSSVILRGAPEHRGRASGSHYQRGNVEVTLVRTKHNGELVREPLSLM
jgi:hypothetical protein